MLHLIPLILAITLPVCSATDSLDLAARVGLLENSIVTTLGSQRWHIEGNRPYTTSLRAIMNQVSVQDYQGQLSGECVAHSFCSDVDRACAIRGWSIITKAITLAKRGIFAQPLVNNARINDQGKVCLTQGFEYYRSIIDPATGNLKNYYFWPDDRLAPAASVIPTSGCSNFMYEPIGQDLKDLVSQELTVPAYCYAATGYSPKRAAQIKELTKQAIDPQICFPDAASFFRPTRTQVLEPSPRTGRTPYYTPWAESFEPTINRDLRCPCEPEDVVNILKTALEVYPYDILNISSQDQALIAAVLHNTIRYINNFAAQPSSED